jgi:amino acid permease
MIGWSWVLLTGEWLARAGTLGTLVAFVIGSGIVLLISLTYAELAAAMPLTGGEHHYTKRALGYTASFVASWAVVVAYVTVCVFESARISIPKFSRWFALGSGGFASLSVDGVDWRVGHRADDLY